MDTLNTLWNLVEYLTVNSAAGIGLPMQNPKQRKTMKVDQESNPREKGWEVFRSGFVGFYHFSGILPAGQSCSETAEISRIRSRLGTICKFCGKPNGKYKDHCQPKLEYFLPWPLGIHTILLIFWDSTILFPCLMGSGGDNGTSLLQFLKGHHFDPFFLF